MPYQVTDVEDEDEDGKPKRQMDNGIQPVRPSEHDPAVSRDVGDVALTAVSADQSAGFPAPPAFTNALMLAAEDVPG